MYINNKINEYLDGYMKVWPFSGVVAVAKDGEVIFCKSYGRANVEHNIPNTTKTVYKIASITKQFTCAGIMLLKQRGLLSLEDSITKFFPDYPDFDERITVHHLMSHTSGLFNDFAALGKYAIIQKFLLTHKEVMDMFYKRPAEFEPGQSWSYCYFGYYLLGLIIEKVSGMSYIDFLKKNIFEPLGMKNTGVDDYFKIIPNKVSGYYATENRLVLGDVDTVSVFSAGAIYSTIEDLLIWDKALYDNKILSEESKAQMFTSFKEDYGYGWIVDKYLGRKRVHHMGGGNGFNHEFHRYLDSRTTIIVLSNYGFSNSLKIADDLARVVFKDEIPRVLRPETFNMDFKIFDEYAGIYEEDWFKLEVKRDGEKLFIVENDKCVMPVYPLSETKFHHTWIDMEFEFEKDEAGNVMLDGIKKK